MVDWIQSTNLLNENCMIVKSTEIMDASSDFTHKKQKQNFNVDFFSGTV